VAPTVLWEMGAEVIAIGVDPDGFNINMGCGSTHPEKLAQRVVAEGADIGFALDGDADRVIVVDETGKVIDGDQLLGLAAISWKENGRLHSKAVVASVMSNLGLELYLKANGLDLIRTPVGDRYVVEEMRNSNINLGGEQSGHIIFSDFTSTGDGLIASLQILCELVGKGKKASELLNVFDPVPQYLKSVTFKSEQPLEDKSVKIAVAAADEKLNGSGRLLVRKSGTEPLIRVMAEGEDEGLIKILVENICSAVEKAA
ncbi:MAG: phosphoglucosamine mutase, partial [Sphingomonadales bacterium]